MGTVCGCTSKKPLQREERDRIKNFIASKDTRTVIYQLEALCQEFRKVSPQNIASYLDIFFEVLNTRTKTYQEKFHVILMLNAAMEGNPTTINQFRKHPLQLILIKEVTARANMDHIVNYQPGQYYSWQERFDNTVLEFFENCLRSFPQQLPDLQKFQHINAGLFPRRSGYLKITSETAKNFSAQLGELSRRRPEAGADQQGERDRGDRREAALPQRDQWVKKSPWARSRRFTATPRRSSTACPPSRPTSTCSTSWS